ncbi:uncharacterized protein LOC128236665 [Mya arenaria]|uniref:uncharacterized protein LOC128236665 n=1 Tax=Mya arenaria TaxID=6604 RepID=UPI0022E34186|nr:uncharacterized protein LOC128236665 [Mya arenaria]
MQTEETFKSRRFIPQSNIKNNSGASGYKSVVLESKSNNFVPASNRRVNCATGLQTNGEKDLEGDGFEHGVKVSHHLLDDDFIKVIVTGPEGHVDVGGISTSENESFIDQDVRRKRTWRKTRNNYKNRRISRQQKYTLHNSLKKPFQFSSAGSSDDTELSDNAFSDSEVYHNRLFNKPNYTDKSHSDLGHESPKAYLPSWIQNATKTTDMASKQVAPEKGNPTNIDAFIGIGSWNISDSRRVMNEQKKVHEKKSVEDSYLKPRQRRHEDVEKEYLKLRHEIYAEASSSGKPPNDQYSLPDTRHASSPVSLTSTRTQVEKHDYLFDTDSLGMNHFKKHIQNVKQSSKRHKRQMRLKEQMLKQNKGKSTINFIPIYET